MMAAYLPLLIVVVSLALFASTTRAQIDESHILLLPYLDRIEAKLEELNGAVASLKNNGACGCTRPRDADRLDRPQKRETKVETLAARDSHLFHVNRLANNLNSIPASSQQDQAPRERQDQQDQDGQQQLSTQAGMGTQSEKRLLLALGQLQESMLGEAFDSMNLILKQQLTSFKSTLIKLSNRLVDHNYQHHVLAEQVSLVRDECSLVASSQQVQGNSSGAQISSPAQQEQALRSSDAIFIRRLSDELSQSFHKSLASGGGASGSSLAICRPPPSSDLVQDEQERHLRQDVSATLSVELKQFQRRVDEIDSVVKQSALLLSKLVAHRSPSGRVCATDDRVSSSSAPPHATTLTFTNMAPGESENSLAGNASQPGKSPSSRWFSGSKVPNQRRGSSVAYDEHLKSDSPGGQARCQTKTSLTRPADCRQLREAGANCSGQYYIFARGGPANSSIRHVLCDMNSEPADEGGGWTLIMRRIDKSLAPLVGGTSGESTWTEPRQQTMTRWLDEIYSSQVDFGQDWASYRGGFGALERWAEFFIGLDLVHQLTRASHDQHSMVQTELQVDLVANSSQELHLKFDDFRLANESEQYELRVGSCNHSSDASGRVLCEPIARLNMTRFFTRDKLVANNCSLAPTHLPGGWWLPPAAASGAEPTHCPATVVLDNGLGLTNRLGKLAAEPGGNGSAQHLYWPGWPPGSPAQPLRQIVLKVRQRRRWRAPKPASGQTAEVSGAQ